jgi:hypothetical protein
MATASANGGGPWEASAIAFNHPLSYPVPDFRAIATRYDKVARNFLAGVHLASAIILFN